MCTPSQVDMLMDEIQRMNRRLALLAMSVPDRERSETYLAKLRADLWIATMDLHKTNNELAAMDPSNQEPEHVAA